MSKFRINIEELNDSLNKNSKELLGIFCIQYPIFCLHSQIQHTNNDELHGIDAMIVYFLLGNPNIEPGNIANFLGLKPKLVMLRLRAMIRDGVVIKEKKNYRLTPLAIDVYINKTQERTFESSYDFYVDAVGMNPLWGDFYTYNYIQDNTYQPLNVVDLKKTKKKIYQPDVVSNVPELNNIKKNILSIPSNKRKDYNIPTGLIDILSIEYHRMSLDLLIVAVKCKTTGNIIKEFINGHAHYPKQDTTELDYYDHLKLGMESFNCMSVKKKINNLCFKITNNQKKESLDNPTKYYLSTNWFSVDKVSNEGESCYEFSDYDLLGYLNTRFIRYRLTRPLRINDIENSSDRICVKVTKDLVLKSRNPKGLLEALARGRDYDINTYRLENNYFLIMFYFKTEDAFVSQLLEFYNEFESVKKNDESIEKEMLLELKHKYDNYREYLNIIGERKVLEVIAISDFMVNF
ncbi:hypothetical protein [Myroides odoratus]|uniref:Uncharacterized protein n=1 Tax=Myroides odoratus TaxID=256 RepID=A0A378RIU6_MYROD|nr:hypothetical protein [Myroides odoratus]QQU02123.1 hypothetical protein I6I89_09585 [Myroides odoratus]STZ26976.1 Uncharacterised protein [Myroides odoratus]